MFPARHITTPTSTNNIFKEERSHILWPRALYHFPATSTHSIRRDHSCNRSPAPLNHARGINTFMCFTCHSATRHDKAHKARMCACPATAVSAAGACKGRQLFALFFPCRPSAALRCQLRASTLTLTSQSERSLRTRRTCAAVREVLHLLALSTRPRGLGLVVRGGAMVVRMYAVYVMCVLSFFSCALICFCPAVWFKEVLIS